MADRPPAEIATRRSRPQAAKDRTHRQPCLLHPRIADRGQRYAGIPIMLGPLAVLIAYAVVFVRCHRRRDVLDFSDNSFG
jgi:hypothetical protein